MRAAVLLLLLLAGCSSTPAVDRPGIIGELAAKAAPVFLHPPEPDIPLPKPGDTCGNCRGRGYVGDGVVKTKCVPCDGTGKVLASVLVQPQQCRDGRCR
jgi:hypothetical protein